MKTTKMFFLMLACAIATSCVKGRLDIDTPADLNENADQNGQTQNPVVFTAVRADYSGQKTKTILTEDYKVFWDSNDAIAVWDGTSIYREEGTKGQIPSQTLRDNGWGVGYKYVATTEKNSGSTGFAYTYFSDSKHKDNYKGTLPEVSLAEGYKDISNGYELAAGEDRWYLMNSNFNINFIANYESKQFRAWLSGSQSVPVGTFEDTRDFAFAKTKDLSEPVVFKNAVSLLEFVVPIDMAGKIKQIVVKPNAQSEYLAGDILVDYSGDAPKTTLWALSNEHNALEKKSGTAELTLKPATGSAFVDGKFYAVACPGTYSGGLTVTATLTDGKTLVRSSSKSCTFEESYVYGMGEINETIYANVTATACEASSSTLAFTWTCGTSVADDIARSYKLELYDMEDNLVVSHEIPVSLTGGSTYANGAVWGKMQPKFVFSGLSQNTSYKFKVTDTDNNLVSNVVLGKTTVFNNVTVPTESVKVGDVILAEDFAELVGGPEWVMRAAGATKSSPLQQISGKCKGNTEVIYYKFDSNAKGSSDGTDFKSEITNTARLSDWAYYKQEGNTLLYSAAGHVKMSSGSATSSLVTPVLTAIPDNMTATLEVKVTMARNATQTDSPLKMAVSNITGTRNTNLSITSLVTKGVTDSQELTNINEWKEYTFTISGVSNTDRLNIRPAENGYTNGKAVHFINDVTVTVKALTPVAE